VWPVSIFFLGQCYLMSLMPVRSSVGTDMSPSTMRSSSFSRNSARYGCRPCSLIINPTIQSIFDRDSPLVLPRCRWSLLVLCHLLVVTRMVFPRSALVCLNSITPYRHIVGFDPSGTTRGGCQYAQNSQWSGNRGDLIAGSGTLTIMRTYAHATHSVVMAPQLIL
jgi:hypothetical protein